MRVLLLCLLLTTPALRAPQRAEDTREPTDADAASLAPRAPIAGMRLVAATSTLRFEGLEDRPHRLEATYLFPDRARWNLRAIGEERERGARLLRFRSGDRCYALAPGQTSSSELRDKDGQQAMLQLELRRAALLWPDGFEWKSEAGVQTATIAGVGQLRAEFAAQPESTQGKPRPVRFTSHYTGGEACERFEAVRWNADDRWPAGWELWLGDRRVWTEELTAIVNRGNFLDCFFLPPDRRRATPSKLGTAQLQHTDLPRRAVRRRALEPAWADLDRARSTVLADAEAWRDELRKAGDQVTVEPSLELDAAGAVSALLLRIDAPDDVPERWKAELVLDGPALIRELEAFGPVPRERLRSLSESRPVGSRPGAFELRWDGKGGARLLLPLLPRTP